MNMAKNQKISTGDIDIADVELSIILVMEECKILILKNGETLKEKQRLKLER